MQFYELRIDMGHFFEVPVVAVFTKFDQFKRNVRMKSEDENDRETDLDTKVEATFNQHYLYGFTKRPPFVRLESEDFVHQLTYTILISVLQKCTNKADVLISLK